MPNMSPKKNPMPHQDPQVRAGNFQEVALGYTKEQAIDEAQRCLNCKNMPCVSGCPVKIHIPAFIAKVAEGDFEAASTNLIIGTDDGSYGKKALVTDLLREQIEAGVQYDRVIAIGPVIMMKFVCQLTKEYNIPTVVSMNPIMIAGPMAMTLSYFTPASICSLSSSVTRAFLP